MKFPPECSLYRAVTVRVTGVCARWLQESWATILVSLGTLFTIIIFVV